MKQFSTTNKVHCSDGTSVTRAAAERLIRAAKAELFARQQREFGYNFCVTCGYNDRAGIPLDASHNKSVAKCFSDGCAELAWSVENMRVRCRDCHNELDGLSIGGKK